MFRKLCHLIGQWARRCGVESEYREYERALFNSSASDALRVENICNARTTTFRNLIQALRVAVQQQHTAVSDKQVELQRRDLENKIREQQQHLKQVSVVIRALLCI